MKTNSGDLSTMISTQSLGEEFWPVFNSTFSSKKLTVTALPTAVSGGNNTSSSLSDHDISFSTPRMITLISAQAEAMCDPPNPPINFANSNKDFGISMSKSVPAHSVIFHQCKNGYEFSENIAEKVYICLQTGQWQNIDYKICQSK